LPRNARGPDGPSPSRRPSQVLIPFLALPGREGMELPVGTPDAVNIFALVDVNGDGLEDVVASTITPFQQFSC